MSVSFSFNFNSDYNAISLTLVGINAITYRKVFYSNLTEEEIEEQQILEEHNFWDDLEE